MLLPPSTVLSLYQAPEPRPVYDIPPVVVSSARWRRLRTRRA